MSVLTRKRYIAIEMIVMEKIVAKVKSTWYKMSVHWQQNAFLGQFTDISILMEWQVSERNTISGNSKRMAYGYTLSDFHI